MNKQDRTYPRTAHDLELKYNLGQNAQGGTGGDDGVDSERLSQILQELSAYKTAINSMIKEIESLADKNQADLESHAENGTVHVTESEKNNLTTAYEHSQKTSGNPHKVTKSDVGLGNVDNTADSNKPVSTAQQNAIDSAYANSNAYTDAKISELVNGAPTTLDTLKEIADAMSENEDVAKALEESIGKKANQAELDTHTGNETIHVTASERASWNAKVGIGAEYYGDMNALVTSGFYRVGTNTNLPDTCQYGQVIVSRGLDTVTQIAGSYHTGKIFSRGCNSPDDNPNWSEWNEYATMEDIEGLSAGGGGFDFSYEEENEALTMVGGSGGTSQWNLLTTKTGTTGQITLPTIFSELHIVIGTASYMLTFNILVDYLTDTATLFRGGYALSDSVYGDAYVSVTKTSINAWTVRKEGVLQEVTVKVYYK